MEKYEGKSSQHEGHEGTQRNNKREKALIV
jgi:hypothetical protein